MHIDLIELFPYKTRNRVWISEIFQASIREFDGFIKANAFPVFIVQGSKNYKPEERSIQFSLFLHLNKKGHKFGLIHVMDENYDHDISVYYLDACSVVFREYFRPGGGRLQLFKEYGKSFFNPIHNSQYTGLKLSLYKIYIRLSRFRFLKDQYLPILPNNSIFHIPLGYTDRFARTKESDIPPTSERNYKWSFCGDSFKADRNLMIETLRTIQPNFIHEYRGFMGEDSLSGEDYWRVLTQSMFIPCPLGNVNIDTYRIFEALEAKAIPLILKTHALQPYDYYHNLLGKHPLPAFSSWQEAEAFLRKMDLNSIKALSEEIVTWYVSFKVDLQNKVQEILRRIAQDALLTTEVNCLDVYASHLHP